MFDSFIEQFKKVFDSEGNTKLCTRVETKKLIDLSKKTVEENKILSEFETMEFGNPHTGFMNKENIMKLKDRINKEL